MLNLWNAETPLNIFFHFSDNIYFLLLIFSKNSLVFFPNSFQGNWGLCCQLQQDGESVEALYTLYLVKVEPKRREVKGFTLLSYFSFCSVVSKAILIPTKETKMMVSVNNDHPRENGKRGVIHREKGNQEWMSRAGIIQPAWNDIL